MLKKLCLLVWLLLSTVAAFANNPNPIALIVVPPDGGVVGNSVDVTGLACPSGGASSVSWTLEYKLVGEANWRAPALATGGNIVGYPVTWESPDSNASDFGLFMTWDTSLIPSGQYQMRVKVTDSVSKNTTSPVVTFTIDHSPPAPQPASPNGPIGVPSGGRYRYTVPSGNATAWVFSTANAKRYSSGPNWIELAFSGGPASVQLQYKQGTGTSDVLNIAVCTFTATAGSQPTSPGQNKYKTKALGYPANQTVQEIITSDGGAAISSSLIVTPHFPSNVTSAQRDELRVGPIQGIYNVTLQSNMSAPSNTTPKHPASGHGTISDSGDAPGMAAKDKLWYGTNMYVTTFPSSSSVTVNFTDAPEFWYLLYTDGGNHGADVLSKLSSGIGTWHADVWFAVGNSQQYGAQSRYVPLRKFTYDLDAGVMVMPDMTTVMPNHERGGTDNITNTPSFTTSTGTLPGLSPTFYPLWGQNWPTTAWPQ